MEPSSEQIIEAEKRSNVANESKQNSNNLPSDSVGPVTILSLRNLSSKIRIFSSTECFLWVFRRISRTVVSTSFFLATSHCLSLDLAWNMFLSFILLFISQVLRRYNVILRKVAENVDMRKINATNALDAGNLRRQVDNPRATARSRVDSHGKIAKTRAGKPDPSLGLGKVTITRAPASGT